MARRFLNLFLLAGLIALFPATMVMAQEQPAGQADDEEAKPDQQETEDQALQQKPQRFMEEIVVTAQRREESVTNVAATINAFSGEDLRELEIGTTAEIDRLISNADFKTSVQGTNPAITLRGVGMNNFNSNNNPSVGVYTNEVFLSSPAMLSLFMMDLDRTEVLKGPQGTLYGRNSNGGAINIISAKPSQVRDSFARLSYGAYNHATIEGAINGGLSDAWAGRLSFMYDTQQDSFYDNILTGENMGSFDQGGLRGQLRYDNGGPLTMNFSLAYLKQDGVNNMQEIYTTNDANDPFSLCPEAAAAAGSGNGVDPRSFPRGGCVSTVGTFDSDPDIFRDDIDPALVDRLNLDTDVTAGIFNLGYDFSGATLTSITSYVAQDRLYGEGIHIPGDIFFVQHEEEIWQFSQELRLNGSSNKMAWLAGLFYSQDQITAFNPLQSAGLFGPFFGLNPLYWDYDQKTTSAAVFGNLDFYLSDSITLVAGLRYTDEEISFVGGTTAFEAGGPFETTTDLLNASQEELDAYGFPLTFLDDVVGDSDTSGRVALEWRPNDNNMLYGSVSSGFKSGGFYGDFTIEQFELTPFEKETVLAYEVGAKSTVAGGALQLNGALFYYDYDNIQTFFPSTVGFRFANLENARIAGLDLDLLWRPTDGLDIMFGAGFLDSKVNSEVPEFDGNVLPNAPEYQFNGLIRYMFAASDNIWLAPLLGFKTSDAKYTEATNNNFNYAPGWTVVDFRLSLFPSDTKWEASIYAQNVFNEEYFQEVFYSDITGVIQTIPDNPATWGVSFTYHF